MSETAFPPPTGLSFERVLPIFALTFVDVLGLTIILPLLHLYALAFGASPVEVGMVMAAFSLSQLIGVPVMGALSDRCGRKPLLLISQVTTFISFLMLASANSLAMVILSRVVDGVFGANLATAQAALSDITTDETRAQGLGLTGAAFGLGFVFGPVIALGALEFTDSLAVPALIAAAYSFISILLTLFTFKETLPRLTNSESTNGREETQPRPNPASIDGEGRRRGNDSSLPPRFVWFSAFRMLLNPHLNLLMALMFVQQLIFFGFESLLGLYTLNRVGLLGQGNAVIFLIVGIILVYVQVQMIGKWSRKYGEAWVASAALGLLAVGLLLMAFTPQQAHPLYVRARVENELALLNPSGTETVIGVIPVALPEDSSRGLGGLGLMLLAIVPLSIGAGLIRPSLNSLMTKRVSAAEFGSVLGISAAFVSAANALAPLLGGWIFQQYGATTPFLLGGCLMALLCLGFSLSQTRQTQSG